MDQNRTYCIELLVLVQSARALLTLLLVRKYEGLVLAPALIDQRLVHRGLAGIDMNPLRAHTRLCPHLKRENEEYFTHTYIYTYIHTGIDTRA